MTKFSNLPSPTTSSDPAASFKAYLAQKIVAPTKIAPLARKLREEGKTIATLNGAFDLLHPGHLFMLFEAAKQADVLIVALNVDQSIQSSKGKNRPVFNLQRRLEMLAPYSFIDYLTYFEEKTPCTLLQSIQPDVHVNGEEYGDNCVEKEVVEKGGGSVYLVPRLAGLSTTNLLEKLMARCD